MPINPQIPLGVQPVQIPLPDPNSGLNALAKALQIKDLQSNSELNALKIDEYKRKIEDDKALRESLAAPGADPYKVLLQRGRVTDAGAFLKSQNEAEKARREGVKMELETSLKRAEHISSILTNARDPQSYGVVRNVIKGQFGVDMPEQFDPAYVQARIAEGQTITQRLAAEHQRLTLEETGRHNRVTETETGRHNRASEGIQVRGQNMVDARSRENNAIQRGAARTEIKETADGFVMIDKGTGAVTPLNGPDGKPLGPKLKEAPPAVQTAVLTNSQNLARAERALALLEGKDIGDPAKGGQKGDKEATGLKGYLPNQVLNRVDPQGVDTRAAIADLGSLVIHDRSGAAVTAAEFPRLAPFIPTEKDDAATAKKKVQRFVQVYREENAAMHQAYNPGTGYKVPGGVAPSPAPTGPKKIANDAEYNALPSGTEFIAPDGSRRRKP